MNTQRHNKLIELLGKLIEINDSYLEEIQSQISTRKLNSPFSVMKREFTHLEKIISANLNKPKKASIQSSMASPSCSVGLFLEELKNALNKI